MMAQSSARLFDDPEWIFETKWDGYRALATVDSMPPQFVVTEWPSAQFEKARFTSGEFVRTNGKFGGPMTCKPTRLAQISFWPEWPSWPVAATKTQRHSTQTGFTRMGRSEGLPSLIAKTNDHERGRNRTCALNIDLPRSELAVPASITS